jgi:pimeloyl-ACP methyl ester carboxylesterase
VVGQLGVDGADAPQHVPDPGRAQARRIARRVPGAHLVELAGSAHFPWYDQPAEFFTALDAWYADQTARTPL